MPRSSNDGKTQIIIALIGSAAVVMGALLANWNNIFGDDAEPKPEIVTNQSEAGDAEEGGALADPQRRPIGEDASAAAGSSPGARPDPVPDISGTWHDAYGQVYIFEQTGADYEYRWSKAGRPMGAGRGHLTGSRFNSSFSWANGARGTCGGRITDGESVATCRQGDEVIQLLLFR